MKETRNQTAVIYCRVSSIKQSTQGDGLSSQETRCREFAGYKGYAVAKVFKDDASGSLTERPGMKAMLGWLKQHRDTIVLIDDISRLARGLEAHLRLRAAIGAVGARLESPTLEFGENSDSVLIENMLATVAQHQREKNAEQTKNRMRSRTLNGYWCFQAPVGYRYQRTPGHGKLLVRDEPAASILQEALEGFAQGRYQSQVEVQRFLNADPEYPKDKSGIVRAPRVSELLNRVLYAGYIEVPNWDVSLRKGKHEGIISYETFQAIQDRLHGKKPKIALRKDISADFPLRGFVTCDGCGKPMTACWSKGRGGRYAYYWCAKHGCTERRKSIRCDKMQAEFEAILADLRPSQNLVTLARAMFKDAWDMRADQGKQRAKRLGVECRDIDSKIETFLDRIVDADSTTIVTAYEQRIRKLEARKIELSEKVAQCGRPVKGFEETFQTTIDFLGNPQKLWESEHVEDKRLCLKLVFADRLPYRRGEGFRTPKTTLPFKVLGDFSSGKFEMARPRGFEPLTS